MEIKDTIAIETPLGSPNTIYHTLANETPKPNHRKTPRMKIPTTIPKIIKNVNFILLIFFSPHLITSCIVYYSKKTLTFKTNDYFLKSP